MRTVTDTVMREMVRAGSSDSAAAIVAISAPHRAKMVEATPAITAAHPCGANPPCRVRLAKDGGAPEVNPKANAPASRMKTMIAATLIEENQNSNSPYERAESRLTAVRSAISTTPTPQTGNCGNQSLTI